jgi:hypothetical protein
MSRFLRGDFGRDHLVRETHELLAFAHLVAHVHAHFSDAIAADLGADHRLLPGVDAAGRDDRARELLGAGFGDAHRHARGRGLGGLGMHGGRNREARDERCEIRGKCAHWHLVDNQVPDTLSGT